MFTSTRFAGLPLLDSSSTLHPGIASTISIGTLSLHSVLVDHVRSLHSLGLSVTVSCVGLLRCYTDLCGDGSLIVGNLYEHSCRTPAVPPPLLYVITARWL